MPSKKGKKQGKVASALDEDTLGYFKRVDDVITDDDFDDEEGRKLFVENVFTQIENNEVKLFCDQMISRTLEKIIIYFSDTQIRTVLQNMEDHFCKIAMDKFGSHVLQTLICIIPKAIRSERSKVRETTQEDKDLKGAEKLFLDICDSFKENLSELVNHVYGSHVLRVVFEVLGGVKVSDNVVRSRASRQSRDRGSHSAEKQPFIKLNQVGIAFGSDTIKPMETIAIPDSFPPVLKTFSKIFIKMDLQKLVLHHISNPLLQTLLLVLHMKDQSMCMKLCRAVMSQIDMFNSKKERVNKRRKSKPDNDDQITKRNSDYRVPVLLSSEISSHMIEKILHVITPELWREIYETFFSTHLSQLAQHPIANFIVQHLMASARDKSHAKQIIAELLPNVEHVLAVEHMGVVIRMVETAVRFSVKQKKILRALFQAFHCEEKDEQLNAVALISSLTTYDAFFGTMTNEKEGNNEKNSTSEERPSASGKLKFVNYHGALLLKTLFDFHKPSKLVKSLLSLSLEEVLILASDPVGSHAVEAFLKSRSVSSDDKHILIEKLQGVFSKLACEKQGSHVIETCWRQAEVKYKEVITRELALSEDQLKDNFYGKFVLRNCGVEHFKRKDKNWHEMKQKADRKRKLLEEILEERDEISVASKKPKPAIENKFAQLAPEMAALGFTTTGNHANGLKEDDDNHNMDTGGEAKRKERKSGSKNSKTKNFDENNSDEEVNFAEMEIINSAIKATKTDRKLKKKRKSKANTNHY